jgi:hypothetical protein
VEASFIRTLVDRMMTVNNVDSVAAMQVLSALLGRKVWPSTDTNFVGMLTLACEMRERGEQGAILSLLCDAGSVTWARTMTRYGSMNTSAIAMKHRLNCASGWAEPRYRGYSACCE